MTSQPQIPEGTLTWLYANLSRGYEEPNRAYSDVVNILSQHPFLTAKTRQYTFENGAQALLLRLNGLLPVSIRGVTYRFPLIFWLVHAYPREPPLVYVEPTPDMAILPGRHVSVDGRIYHPYLAQWSKYWDRSNVSDLVRILQDIFAKEPPVVAKQQQQQHPSVVNGSEMPARGVPSRQTPLRPDSADSSRRSHAHSATPGPPPPPPKPPEMGGPNLMRTNQLSEDTASPPPRPPKPGDNAGHVTHAFSGNHSDKQYQTHIRPQSRLYDQWHDATRTTPPQLDEAQSQQHWTSIRQQQQALYQHREATQQNRPFIPHQQHHPYHPQAQVRSVAYSQGQQRQQQQQVGQSAQQQTAQSLLPHAKQPPPDLMDLPLEVTLPSQHATSPGLPAPPVPPNPEKDALLSAISTRLLTELHTTVQQNRAALPLLQGQNVALQQAFGRMQNELEQLGELNATLSSNEQILKRSMQDADRVVESAGSRALPDVDEVLVAPIVVGEQLYKLVADERSISDAMFMLTRALDRGRVAPDVFVRQTRALAREQFLKRALIRKIGQGLGLNVEQGFVAGGGYGM